MTPVNTPVYSPARPAAPLETKRPAHTAPRQGRHPDTEVPETADAKEGAPSLAVTCIPSDLLGMEWYDPRRGWIVGLHFDEVLGYPLLSVKRRPGVREWRSWRRPTREDIVILQQAKASDSNTATLPEWNGDPTLTPVFDPAVRFDYLADQADKALTRLLIFRDEYRDVLTAPAIRAARTMLQEKLDCLDVGRIAQ